MSRSGLQESDDQSDWLYVQYRSAVSSSIRGKRGQSLLRDLAAAMDAMIEKRLIKGALSNNEGDYCAIGLALQCRNKTELLAVPIDLQYDIEPEQIAAQLNIANALAREIIWQNDESGTTDYLRWQYMCSWISMNIHDQEVLKK